MSATFLLVIKRIYIRMRVGGKGSLWLVLVICFPIMHRGSLSGWQSSWGTHSGKNLHLRPPPACVLALCCFQQRQRSPVCVVNNKTPAIKRVTMFTHYDYVLGSIHSYLMSCPPTLITWIIPGRYVMHPIQNTVCVLEPGTQSNIQILLNVPVLADPLILNSGPRAAVEVI